MREKAHVMVAQALPDPTPLVRAVQDSTPTAVVALAILALIGAVTAAGFVAVKVVAWATAVTTLLGNHLRHDLQDQTEQLRRIGYEAERTSNLLADLVRELRTDRQVRDKAEHL